MQFQNRYHRHTDLGVVLIALMRRTEALTLLTASTPFAYPQVIPRGFAYFRVAAVLVCAGQEDFCAEFDSRQLHRKGRRDAALFPWIARARLISRHDTVVALVARPHGLTTNRPGIT